MAARKSARPRKSAADLHEEAELEGVKNRRYLIHALGTREGDVRRARPITSFDGVKEGKWVERVVANESDIGVYDGNGNIQNKCMVQCKLWDYFFTLSLCGTISCK